MRKTDFILQGKGVDEIILEQIQDIFEQMRIKKMVASLSTTKYAEGDLSSSPPKKE